MNPFLATVLNGMQIQVEIFQIILSMYEGDQD